ncbi:hypothetical protein BH11BAC3_BH11BAC3_01870 [soil metagenome]
MKTITVNTATSFPHVQYRHQQSFLTTIKTWIKEQEPLWEYNRLGIAATGIFIQVTFAAAMISILALANASPWIYGIGILFAFMANSIAFAQSPMRWVLAIFVVSILLNFSLALLYGIPLLTA